MRWITAAVVAVLVVSAGSPGGAQTTNSDAEILETTYSGDLTTGTGRQVGWLSDTHRVTVTVGSDTGLEAASVCLEPGANATTTGRLACAPTSVPAGTNRTVTLTVPRWPENLTGRQTVSVVLVSPDRTGTVQATAPLSVTVLRRDGDLDDDGLSNRAEVSLGTDPLTADTDSDGLEDGAEVHSHETSPLSTDTDADGLSDRAEVDEFGTNPLEADTDGDGLLDNVEVNTHDSDPRDVDSDSDGLTDGDEVDRFETDPTVADTDGDGLDDGPEVQQYGTDPTTADTDGDGLEDGAEVNRYGTDPTVTDTDGDGVADLREVNRGGGPLLDPTTGIALVLAIVLLTVGAVYLFSRATRARGWLPGRSTASSPTGTSTEGSKRDSPGPDVLAPPDRVAAVLSDHGGQVRQSTIVEETDWSKSKVSRVLSSMEEEGRIVKVDIGRGNLITRPEDAPPGFRSASEE